MARCANCGREIPGDDKTRLCEDCKRVILPFIKFMDVSDTPAVKRLLSNEKNLRDAGVTDSGMDYLYRICELHDRKFQSAQEAKANSSTAAAFGTASDAGRDKEKKITAASLPSPHEKPGSGGTSAKGKTSSAEIRAAFSADSDDADGEEEETKSVGRALPAAKWILILAGTASLVWFAAKIATRAFVGESLTDSIDVAALAAALSSYAGAYIAGVAKKAADELDELRKKQK